jgi:hypothetical protein
VVGFDFDAFQWKMIAVSPAVRVLSYEHDDPYGESPPHYGYGHYAARVGVRLQTRF